MNLKEMTVRELRRECERFSHQMMARGADPHQFAGLLIGAGMRALRAGRITKAQYLEACELLWDNNNAPDAPVDDAGDPSSSAS